MDYIQGLGRYRFHEKFARLGARSDGEATRLLGFLCDCRGVGASDDCMCWEASHKGGLEVKTFNVSLEGRSRGSVPWEAMDFRVVARQSESRRRRLSFLDHFSLM